MRRHLLCLLGVALCLSASGLTGCQPSDAVRLEDPAAATYEPTAPQVRDVGSRLVGPIVYTVDARSNDVWMYFSFTLGAVIPVQDPKTLPWDLMLQRYVIKTNGGQTNPSGQAGLLSVPGHDLAALTSVPANATFVTDVPLKNRPGSYNPAIEKWFNYSYLANILAPKPLLYLVRTHDGKYAKLRLLSYYCVQRSAGCVTFEYVYQGDGSTTLSGPAS